MRWLHTQWPAGVVEKLPAVRPDGSTNIPGLYIVGDLTGIPLLKFAAQSGAQAVGAIVEDPAFKTDDKASDGMLDLAIVGAGVSGMAAALEARARGLSFVVLEATEPFSTIVNFPKGKPIYTYPTSMVPSGHLQLHSVFKEDLLQELRAQTLDQGIPLQQGRAVRVERERGGFAVVLARGRRLQARRVIVAIGRSGNFRKLEIPGEELGKVGNRLHDPKDYEGKNVLVVGGGDSALETAIAVAQCGGKVTLSCRRKVFSRAKPENVDMLLALAEDPEAEVAIETPISERITTSAGPFLGKHRHPGSMALLMGSTVKEITEETAIVVEDSGEERVLPNDAVFVMIGREAPLEFLRRSGIPITGEITRRGWAGMALFVAFCAFVYLWKSGGMLTGLFRDQVWFPFNIPLLLKAAGGTLSAMAADPSTLVGTLSINLGDPGFYYSLLYTFLVIVFGYRRIRRRATPYVTAQTLTLTAIQVIPLFLLPYIILPLLGHSGSFDTGLGKTVADALFPAVSYGHGREYWRAFGLILAWPLFLWNIFSSQPLLWWLLISVVQTFVLIPLLVHFWGKGAYCGWICSCGAMAETVGDTHRHKMPHGAGWNRLNMAGQAILAIAFLLLVGRIASWLLPQSGFSRGIASAYLGLLQGWEVAGIPLNYKFLVDLFLAGIVGYGAYFWFSGRVWCRFACPLAALMHIYARFSRFRIFADKKKCISCNVCTSVCHQGIDIMNFANKGLPMEDPECVRCSACVQSCPTGVLAFGGISRHPGGPVRLDTLDASPVVMRERAESRA